MSTVRRGTIAADNFVTVSNAFVRDGRLSLKARMLGVWLMSHRDGWHVSVETIAKTIGEKDGVAAIRSGLIELEEAGYLVREQGREGSKFGHADYVISDVPAGETVSRFPASGEPRPREIAPHKKTIPQEEHQEEPSPAGADGALFEEPKHTEPASPPKPVVYSEGFEQAWVAYGRKGAKRAAWAEWQRAIQRADVEVIAAGIAPYLASKPDRTYRKDFERWLKGDVWESADAQPADAAPPAGTMSIEDADSWLFDRYQAGDAEAVAKRTGCRYSAPHPQSIPKAVDPEEYLMRDRQAWIKTNRPGLTRVLMGKPFSPGMKVQS